MTQETQGPTPSEEKLTPGTRRLVEMTRAKAGEAATGINHWLLALVERHGPMAEVMAKGLNPSLLAGGLREKLARGEIGTPQPEDILVAQAFARAQGHGKAQASERDLAAVILAAAGYDVAAETIPASVLSADSPSAGSAGNALEDVAKWQSRVKRPTPALDKFGRDMTRAAAENKFAPLVGRDEEVRLIIETLCRRTKRNPVLVGPAGVGKTAIVEGLAQRIVQRQVPEPLRGARLVSLSRSALLAGVQSAGDVNARLQAILHEAGQEGLLLFIDELHSFVGFADDFKPALARGEVACLGATTDDEYRRFVEEDRALERRFQPLRIQPLTAPQTLAVLESLRSTLAEARGVHISSETLSHLVDLAERFLPNREFPDKGVDLMEQCIAHAVAEGKLDVSTEDADNVVQRLIGMPISPETRLDALAQRLAEDALLPAGDAAALRSRLGVTMGGLDLCPARPNATLLLLNAAAENAGALACALADTLYGSKERVVTIDFGRMIQDHDVSMLIGSPPGYIGYSQRLLIHQVAQMPWCVILCANVHACHRVIRAVLGQALASGQITDASGKRIYLSDATVVLTAAIEPPTHRAMGFHHEANPETKLGASHAFNGNEGAAERWREAAADELGADLVDECDLVCAGIAPSDSLPGKVSQTLMAQMNERYSKRGLSLSWDGTLTDWLDAQSHVNARAWERLMDERLSPLIIPYLPQGNVREPLRLCIKVDGETIRVLPDA